VDVGARLLSNGERQPPPRGAGPLSRTLHANTGPRIRAGEGWNARSRPGVDPGTSRPATTTTTTQREQHAQRHVVDGVVVNVVVVDVVVVDGVVVDGVVVDGVVVDGVVVDGVVVDGVVVNVVVDAGRRTGLRGARSGAICT
jgi:hypothetical protein